jgi:hypothetical protein
MPDKLAGYTGCGGAGADADESAEVGARAGGSTFLGETAHKSEWQAIGGIRKRA